VNDSTFENAVCIARILNKHEALNGRPAVYVVASKIYPIPLELI